MVPTHTIMRLGFLVFLSLIFLSATPGQGVESRLDSAADKAMVNPKKLAKWVKIDGFEQYDGTNPEINAHLNRAMFYDSNGATIVLSAGIAGGLLYMCSGLLSILDDSYRKNIGTGGIIAASSLAVLISFRISANKHWKEAVALYSAR